MIGKHWCEPRIILIYQLLTYQIQICMYLLAREAREADNNNNYTVKFWRSHSPSWIFGFGIGWIGIGSIQTGIGSWDWQKKVNNFHKNYFKNTKKGYKWKVTIYFRECQSHLIVVKFSTQFYFIIESITKRIRLKWVIMGFSSE